MGNIQIGELLQEWLAFKQTSAYNELLHLSVPQTAHETELKSRRDRLRFLLHQRRQRGASVQELASLQQDFEEAKAAYAATGRSGKSSGVACHL